MQLPQKNPNVVFQRVTDGAVLLSTQDEVYYGLDPIGAQVWELLDPSLGSFDALCHALNEHYPDVPYETIRSDLTELLTDMLQSGLLRPPEP